MAPADSIIDNLQSYGFEPFDWQGFCQASKPYSEGLCTGRGCDREPIVQEDRPGGMKAAWCLRHLITTLADRAHNGDDSKARFSAVIEAITDAIRQPTNDVQP